MKRIALYPGSFDPFTTGHLDILRRASMLFDEVVIAVIRNPHKSGWLPVAERVRLLERCTQDMPNVQVDSFSGLTVTYAEQIGATVILRGLRDESDFAAEKNLAQVNKHLNPNIETLCMLCSPEHTIVSSSNVREMAAYGCDLTGFVPEAIRQDIINYSNALTKGGT